MARKALKITKLNANGEPIKIQKREEPVEEFVRDEVANESISKMNREFKKLNPIMQIEALKALGMGSTYFTCQRCGKIRNKINFYRTNQPEVASGYVSICRYCVDDIVQPKVNGKVTEITKESVDKALFYLDKPFLDSVWESSIKNAASNRPETRNSIFAAYMTTIQLPQYDGKTYRDSDNYTGGIFSLADMKEDALPKDQEIIEQFEKNKSDCLRLLGYLPFEKERLSDQPFLYAQLLGFLDSSEEGNDDMMRISSIISIVRGFLQQSQIDDRIAEIMADPAHFDKNMLMYKGLEEMKKNITLSITKLAEQSCISLKHSKNAKKGENTWTGKIKKIKELNLREGELNGFDIETCKAMQQVMDMSNASILKQLRLDESEYSEIIAEQRKMITQLQKELDSYTEISRILLRENLDIKDYLQKNGIEINFDYVDLEDLMSPFMGLDRDDEIELSDLVGEEESEIAEVPDESDSD